MLRYIGAERWGKMIRIAICDDEERAVASTEKIVKTCLQAQGIGCEITTYTQSRNLLYDITDDGFFYDLILLDIEMPGISCMEIPQQVKAFLPTQVLYSAYPSISYFPQPFLWWPAALCCLNL